MRFALCVQQNVSRFDITMQYAVFVRVMNSTCDVRDQFHRPPDRHWLAPSHFVKLAAFDELHAEVTRAIALADFMDWNDAVMLQPRRGFGFETETSQVRF